MGKITIHVDADINDKQLKFTFNWNGDDEAIENIMRFIERMADQAGTTTEAVTQSILHHLPGTGLMNDPGAREVQMMAILYTVLQFPTNSPDRPGAIYNYAATENIDAKLTVRDGEINADISGRFLGH